MAKREMPTIDSVEEKAIVEEKEAEKKVEKAKETKSKKCGVAKGS